LSTFGQAASPCSIVRTVPEMLWSPFERSKANRRVQVDASHPHIIGRILFPLKYLTVISSDFTDRWSVAATMR
jgi:hypothetical protein